jgi:hypothetical protein
MGAFAMQSSTKSGSRALALAMTLAAVALPAAAAENGAGVYPLGLRANLSGLVPAPGVYIQNDLYYYNSDTASAVAMHGHVVADIRATSWINLTTLLWSTPLEIAGGNLALSATLPVGGPDINAGAEYLGNNLATPIRRDVNGSTTTVGDPFLVAAIGWHAGNLHWTTGVGVNVPAGDYHAHDIANLAFNHWAADVYGGVTWLDPLRGLELSTSVGVTFNGENDITHYTTGDELHVDFAAVKHLPNGFSVGLVGYHYDQLTGDSGTGAVLGDFKGRVTALGGTFGYMFKVADRDLSANIKVFREFDTRNRLDGTAAYLTISLPLTTPQAAAPAKPGRIVK